MSNRKICAITYAQETNGYALRFSKEDAKAMEAGKTLVMKGGDCHGDLEIRICMVRMTYGHIIEKFPKTMQVSGFPEPVVLFCLKIKREGDGHQITANVPLQEWENFEVGERVKFSDFES